MSQYQKFSSNLSFNYQSFIVLSTIKHDSYIHAMPIAMKQIIMFSWKKNYFKLTGFVDYAVWKCHLANSPSDLDCQDPCSQIQHQVNKILRLNIKYSFQRKMQWFRNPELPTWSRVDL